MSETRSSARLDSRRAPARVVIAGGGVAAVETLLALHDLAGERVATTVVAPERTFTASDMAVASVFSRGRRRRVDLAELADEFVCDSVAAVEPDVRRVRRANGEQIDYDHLVLTVGARARPAWRHAITFGEDPTEEALHTLIDEIERGYATSVAFVVPSGIAWPLPLYELAIMTARQAWTMGIDRVRFVFITPEERPLAVFGRAPSRAIAELLDGCGIAFLGSTYASVEHCIVRMDPSRRTLANARVVSPPLLVGPDLPGVPADPSGFIPSDAHGRVPGLSGVYAAGDGTTFPIKQGGLATQQADAVAETIAAEVGALVTPEPFRPILRAVLLTGGDPRYMQHDLAGGDGEGAIATAPLWRPPVKLTGRYLSEHLLARDDAASTNRALSAPGLARAR